MSYNKIHIRILLLSLVLSCFIIASLYYALYWDNLQVSVNSSSDVRLVVARMQHEDASWLDQYLPQWQKSIYTVDDPSASLTVPRNKGRESMVYLT